MMLIAGLEPVSSLRAQRSNPVFRAACDAVGDFAGWCNVKARGRRNRRLDCFVTSFLAMTAWVAIVTAHTNGVWGLVPSGVQGWNPWPCL